MKAKCAILLLWLVFAVPASAEDTQAKLSQQIQDNWILIRAEQRALDQADQERQLVIDRIRADVRSILRHVEQITWNLKR